jgi:predicted MFS family arabinose efflux permease
MLLAGLFGAGFGAFFQYAPLLADRRGVIAADTLYQAYGVGIILMRLISRTIQDRWPLRRILVVAASMKVIGLLLLGLSLHPWLLIAAAMIIAGGSGVFHPALLAYHAASWPEAPGRATAASYIGFDLGIGGGSFAVGVALQYAGIPGLYLLAAAITALVIPLTLRLPRS